MEFPRECWFSRMWNDFYLKEKKENKHKRSQKKQNKRKTNKRKKKNKN